MSDDGRVVAIAGNESMTNANSPSLKLQLDQYTRETELAVMWDIDIEEPKVVVEYTDRPKESQILSLLSRDSTLTVDGTAYELTTQSGIERMPSRLAMPGTDQERTWLVEYPLAET